MFDPYPALTKEFGRGILRKNGMSFDRLDDAAKALATQGREAAAIILGEPK